MNINKIYRINKDKEVDQEMGFSKEHLLRPKVSFKLKQIIKCNE